MVLEDAHWMDARRGMDGAAGREPCARRVLLIVTYRPGYTPAFGDPRSHAARATTCPPPTACAGICLGDQLPARNADREGRATRSSSRSRALGRGLGGRCARARAWWCALRRPRSCPTPEDIVTARIDRHQPTAAAAPGWRRDRLRERRRLSAGSSSSALDDPPRAAGRRADPRRNVFPGVLRLRTPHARRTYASVPALGGARTTRSRALEALHGDRAAKSPASWPGAAGGRGQNRRSAHLVRAAGRRRGRSRRATPFCTTKRWRRRAAAGTSAGVAAIHRARSALCFVVSDFRAIPRDGRARANSDAGARPARVACRHGVGCDVGPGSDSAVAHARRAIEVAEPVGRSVLAPAQLRRLRPRGDGQHRQGPSAPAISSRAARRRHGASLAGMTTAGLIKAGKRTTKRRTVFKYVASRSPASTICCCRSSSAPSCAGSP
jgi:hypothetical protein